ncbi:hypothetical protein Hanom_Chr17g01563001 [Helianthus anomalus]
MVRLIRFFAHPSLQPYPCSLSRDASVLINENKPFSSSVIPKHPKPSFFLPPTADNSHLSFHLHHTTKAPPLSTFRPTT